MLMKLKTYKNTALGRKQKETQLKLQRWKRSLEIAQKAAILLRQQFKVQEVICFGSILQSDRFTLTSDIDLAVKGLAVEQFFRAVAQLQDLSPEFKIDLVDLDRCCRSLKIAILLDGQPL